MQLKKFQYTIFLFIIFLSIAGFSQTPVGTLYIELKDELFVPLTSWKYKTGDNIDWAKPDYNDSLWQTKDKVSKVDTSTGIVWYRLHLNLKGELAGTEILTLITIGLARSYDIYWDGRLIKENGTVSSKKENVKTGLITLFLKLNPQVTKAGHHVLSLRVSNYFPRFKIRERNIFLLTYSSMFRILTKNLQIYAFLLGFNILAVLLSVALFLIGGRHRSYLYFGIYRLFYMVYSIVEILLFQHPISMEYNDLLMLSIYFFDPLSMVFLCLYVVFNFNLPRKYLHCTISFIFFILIDILFKGRYINFILLYSIGMIIWAVRKKEPGSIIALLGFAEYTTVLIIYFMILRKYSYVTVWADVIFVFFALLSISRQVRIQYQKHHHSIQRSLRLESELLKKNIQPHFLMNTLLNIISWIKKNPDNAIKLIQSLATEFKFINKISSERIIPVIDEIKLCENHLELMGFRKMAQYQLITNGICPDEKVPPMIFHTLIENGLTHSYKAYENGTFYLSCSRENGQIQYVLQNDGSKISKIADLDNQQFQEGMGFRYVKARLEESYPGRWEMIYGQNNGFWEVKIAIKR